MRLLAEGKENQPSAKCTAEVESKREDVQILPIYFCVKVHTRRSKIAVVRRFNKMGRKLAQRRLNRPMLIARFSHFLN